MAQVHASKIAGEEGRLVATGTGPDLDERTALVVRVTRQQRGLELEAQRLDVRPGRLHFFLRHLGHVSLDVGGVEHLLRRREIAFALLKARGSARHGR